MVDGVMYVNGKRADAGVQTVELAGGESLTFDVKTHGKATRKGGTKRGGNQHAEK